MEEKEKEGGEGVINRNGKTRKMELNGYRNK